MEVLKKRRNAHSGGMVFFTSIFASKLKKTESRRIAHSDSIPFQRVKCDVRTNSNCPIVFFLFYLVQFDFLIDLNTP